MIIGEWSVIRIYGKLYHKKAVPWSRHCNKICCNILRLLCTLWKNKNFSNKLFIFQTIISNWRTWSIIRHYFSGKKSLFLMEILNLPSIQLINLPSNFSQIITKIIKKYNFFFRKSYVLFYLGFSDTLNCKKLGVNSNFI